MSSAPGGDDQAHDVLAADEFAVPAPEPLHHARPVVLPDDPTGETVPHDVLAAEDFAIPAARGPRTGGMAARRGGGRRLAAEVAALALLFALVRRRVTRG